MKRGRRETRERRSKTRDARRETSLPPTRVTAGSSRRRLQTTPHVSWAFRGMPARRRHHKPTVLQHLPCSARVSRAPATDARRPQGRPSAAAAGSAAVTAAAPATAVRARHPRHAARHLRPIPCPPPPGFSAEASTSPPSTSATRRGEVRDPGDGRRTAIAVPPTEPVAAAVGIHWRCRGCPSPHHLEHAGGNTGGSDHGDRRPGPPGRRVWVADHRATVLILAGRRGGWVGGRQRGSGPPRPPTPRHLEQGSGLPRPRREISHSTGTGDLRAAS